MVLRLSERYTSTQGEGPRTGLPTQFVRFGGCNLRCPGWGTHVLPNGEAVGACDTPYAVYPQYRDEWEKWTPEELYNSLPDWPKNICLTGGEPFVQPERDLEEFINLCRRRFTVECFTNGTFLFPQWSLPRLQFVMDWKLQGSGEVLPTQREQHRFANARALGPLDAIKFTVADLKDLLEAADTYDTLKAANTYTQFWVGAVWDRIKDEQIVDFIKDNQLDWHLNVQVHKHVWDPETRGI